MDYTLVENQTSLKERLKNGSVLVSFTKKDGSRRDMLCTLAPASIPAPTPSAKEKSTRAVSSESLAVYDTVAGAWRSFRWDSIISVKG